MHTVYILCMYMYAISVSYTVVVLFLFERILLYCLHRLQLVVLKYFFCLFFCFQYCIVIIQHKYQKSSFFCTNEYSVYILNDVFNI